VSEASAGSLRHALKQVAVTGATGSLLLGGAVTGLATSAPAATATAATTAPVKLRVTPTVAHFKKKVNVALEMRTAKALRGRPYRYGAAGPWAFDCSGYTQYVFKRQAIKLARTAAGQYRQTLRVSHMKARVGDLVFFYNGSGVYHVGIVAGHMTMWAAPHTGTVVRKQKIYRSNWKIGRVVS
jgi:cell wall-associated NlpC family hydrolase